MFVVVESWLDCRCGFCSLQMVSAGVGLICEAAALVSRDLWPFAARSCGDLAERLYNYDDNEKNNDTIDLIVVLIIAFTLTRADMDDLEVKVVRIGFNSIKFWCASFVT